MDKKPIIHLYTFCWNEMDILPFVIDYWKQYVTHAFVYEKGSTDGSREYLQQFEWITVLDYPVDGINDVVLRERKNNCWKESRGKCDLVIVCDMDECLWSWDIDNVFKKFINGEYSYANFDFYNLRGLSKPEYKEGVFVHEMIDKARVCYGKTLLFDPLKIKEINYDFGAHLCHPTGELKEYLDKDALSIHIEKGFGPEYRYKRYKEMESRMTEINKRGGLGVHYTFPKDKIVNDYLKEREEGVVIADEIEKLKQQYNQKAP